MTSGLSKLKVAQARKDGLLCRGIVSIRAAASAVDNMHNQS
jgi:hypothetical protein